MPLVNERLAVALLAVLSAIGFLLAPWAALNREIGARSTVLLLPGRVFDFTGRTDPVSLDGLGLVLAIGLLALLVLVVTAWLPGKGRFVAWLAAGILLLASTGWGLDRVGEAVDQARLAAFVGEVERAIGNPRPNQDVAALERVVAEADERTLEQSRAAALEAGLNIRRLPFMRAGMGLAAFLAGFTGALALLFGLRALPGASRFIDDFLAAVAVPATSIALALLASALVILLLQPTPMGSGVEIEGPLMGLAGRLDTLWYAYLTLFADSLGTLAGFFEALKFATPLIFTGLAVAFGFRAGLFNIGAPGQMILGALGAAAVAIYLPGPGVIVLPLAVIAAALTGGLWGALPGWLKARFGANEVINTILLNYVAASLLLFLLSDRPTFAAPALNIVRMLGPAAIVIVIALLIPPLRRAMGRSPRLSFAVGGVLLLMAMVAVAAPAAGEPPVIVDLPFKAPGSEPKSYPLQPQARVPQLPALLGIDLRTSPGVNEVDVDLAAWLAPLVGLLALWLAPRFGARRPGLRLLVAAASWGLGYVLLSVVGLAAVEAEIPPTNLNLSFLLALLAAVFMQVLLWRTKWGYELRAVGVSPKAAEYGGANIGRNVVVAMAISGAFAGLTATHYVLGGALEDYSLRQSLPTGDGFDGIAVALLGGNTPVGVVLAAFLFGVLKNGGSILNITFSDLTRDVVSMILALVVLFIAARGFLPERLSNPLRRRQIQQGELDTRLKTPLDAPGKPLRAEEG
jgi:ABC-type uncharacterized transport system permease subunit